VGRLIAKTLRQTVVLDEPLISEFKNEEGLSEVYYRCDEYESTHDRLEIFVTDGRGPNARRTPYRRPAAPSSRVRVISICRGIAIWV
jgi:hypothetical protein